MTPREKIIIDLLLQGAENGDIARELHIKERTVKAHFNRMFRAHGITSGIKRVKLAVLLYRLQLCEENSQDGYSPNGTTASSNMSPTAAKTGILPS